MDGELETQLQKLRGQVGAKVPHQQQQAAMLLAIEDTIKEQQAAADPASYFAALLTLLEQQAGAGKAAISGSAMFLLSLVLPHVSQTVLRAKFTTMMAVLSQSLDLGSADVALLRSVIACLEAVLLAQDAGSWRQAIAQATFRSLLQLSTDSKPKIRKRAQEAASGLLSKPPPPTVVHPAAPIAVRHVLETLANAKADTQSAMHILQLVKQTEMVWPPDSFGELCASLMQLPRLNTPYLSTLSLQALESMFSTARESLDEDQFRDLLVSVIDLKPNVNDGAASEAWLKIIQKGYVAYASISPEACFQSLPDLIDIMLPDIELGKQSTRDTATRSIWALISECIPGNMLESQGIQQIAKTLGGGLSYRYRESWALVFLLIAALFQRLAKAAHPVMDEIIVEVANMRMDPEFQFKDEADAVLGAAIRAIGPQAFLEVLPLNLDAVQRPGEVGRAWLLPLMKGHIRNAPLGYFVSTMLPLADSLTAQSQQSVSRGREIEAKVYGALSQQVWSLLGGFCNVSPDVVEAFTPEFAERLATEMQEVVETRPAICGALTTLVSAVHTLAHSSAANAPLSPQQAQAAEAHLARYAPDYLAQLFNVFAQSPSASRGFLIDTITAFLAVISPAEVNATFVKVCTMLDKALKGHRPPAAAELTEQYLEAHPPPTAHTMTDLAIVMAPYLDGERAQMLLRAALVLANQSEDVALQKKGYKALGLLASQPAESPARQLIEASMTEKLIPMLVESTASVAAGSRGSRLALISSLARNLADNQLHFIPAVVSEVIIGTKEVNDRTRTMAFDTLLVMARRMAQGGVIDMSTIAEAPGTMDANIEEFMNVIIAGLGAKTPYMVSATVAAMSRVLFEFHQQLNTELVVNLFDLVLTSYVVHNNREIARASLGFVKVVVVVLPNDILLDNLATIMQSILKWSHEFKNKMRLKCRHIIDRLVRRLGLEAVAKVTPTEHEKLIMNMRKRQQRQQRTKENAGAGRKGGEDRSAQAKTVAAAASAVGKKSFGNTYEDVIYGSESEFEDSADEDQGSSRKKASSKKGKAGRKAGDHGSADPAGSGPGSKSAWIKEDTEGPLDFLDRTAFTHFSSADPTAPKPRRAHAEPKMRGGKLVFEDEQELARRAQAAAAAAAAAEGTGDAAGGENYYLQSLTSKDGYYRTEGQGIKFRKRKPGESDDEMDLGSDGEGTARPSPTKRGKGSGGGSVGREFRAKKAQGDVKRGNIDPYAYIPLNPKTMKKGAISVKGNSKRDKRTRVAKG
ncbi:pre-rRNA processing protein [Coemansia sp. RSA 552]|nr:pre-rRNA processing protein [Coemansia sp. RSA 552]